MPQRPIQPFERAMQHQLEPKPTRIYSPEAQKIAQRKFQSQNRTIHPTKRTTAPVNF